MKKVILLTVFTFLFSLGFSFAEVPCKINYQGRLIKDNVPVDGTVNMEFNLYTQLTGGTAIKTISMSNVPVYNGLFRAVLDLEGIDWAAGQTMYLELKAGTDVLSPREELYAYPYAINTRFLGGNAKDYFLNTSADTQAKQGNLNIMGMVGIRTTSPKAPLDVRGSMNMQDGKGACIIYFPNTGTWPKFLIRSDDDPNSYEPESERLCVEATGNVGIGTQFPTSKLYVNGTFTATGAKNFEIDHPTKPGMKLVHSTLEGPEVAVFYRGEARLKDGQAVIQLPDYFEALTRKEGRTVLLTAKGNQPYIFSTTDVSDGKFKVYGTKPDGEFYWEVKAIRADIQPLQVEK